VTARSIELVAPGEFARDKNKIIFIGVALYRVAGRGVQQPGAPHAITMWDNTFRPIRDGFGWIEPNGQASREATSVMASAQQSMLAAHREAIAALGQADPEIREREPLAVHDQVRLAYPDGTVSGLFVVHAPGSLADPMLVPVPSDPVEIDARGRARRLGDMCLGDIGAYGTCVLPKRHTGLCMEETGHRFYGHARRL